MRDPAVTTGSIAYLSVNQVFLSLPYSAYESILNAVEPFNAISSKDQELLDLYESRQFHSFLHKAVAYEKNIIISA